MNLRFNYDAANDVITIEGVKYHGDFFRGLGGGLHLGDLFRVVARDGGVLIVQSAESSMPLAKTAPVAPAVVPPRV